MKELSTSGWNLARYEHGDNIYRSRKLNLNLHLMANFFADWNIPISHRSVSRTEVTPAVKAARANWLFKLCTGA
jgi:hypothetical protein